MPNQQRHRARSERTHGSPASFLTKQLASIKAAVGALSQRPQALIDYEAAPAEEDGLAPVFMSPEVRNPDLNISHRVLMIIEQNPHWEFSPLHLAGYLKVQVATVRSVVMRLHQEGKINKVERGRYTWRSEGWKGAAAKLSAKNQSEIAP